MSATTGPGHQKNNVLTIDFETRSQVNLKKVGMHRYAEDPSTKIICLALKWNDQPAMVFSSPWVGGMLLANDHFNNPSVRGRICAMIRGADIIEAHNVGFERCMWHSIMYGQYKYMNLPLEKLRDSAALAAIQALPRELGKACAAMNVPEQKDKKGHALMLQMCKPRGARKDEDPNGTYWFEDVERIRRLMAYCKQDVEAEYSLSQAIREMWKPEYPVWRVDQDINFRGVKVDTAGCKTLKLAVDRHKKILVAEFQALAGGIRPTQGARVLELLAKEGAYLDNLKVESVKDALAGELSDLARKMLEIRQTVAKTSVTKLNAMLKMACNDNRVRGTLMYCGAGTGRWTARGIQPQNFPRTEYKDKDIEEILELIKSDSLDIFYDNPTTVVSECLRGMILAPEGKDFICADFASIEGRVLAWFANEYEVLEGYRTDDLHKGEEDYWNDAYIRAAAGIYHKKIADVTKEERSVGKVAELALGYQGGWNALMKMAVKFGVKLSKIEAKSIVKNWREARANTESYWYSIERAAIKAVKAKGAMVRVGKVVFAMRGNYLVMKLPSGRVNYFNSPQLEWDAKYKSDKLTCMRMNSKNQWARTSIYGGLITENIVQAAARDLMANGMLKVESDKYQIVLTIHDEIVSECDEGQGNLPEFCKLMCDKPEWAKDIPVTAEGWIGKRYRK